MILWCIAYSMHYKNNNPSVLSGLEFQKRVLQLLVEIKDALHVATSSAGRVYEVKPANTEEEFQALENRLEDENEGAELVSFNPNCAFTPKLPKWQCRPRMCSDTTAS